MLEDSVTAVELPHQHLKMLSRDPLKSIHLPHLVQEDRYASPSVTSFLPPSGLTVDAIRAGLKKRFGIVIADGQKDLKGNILRIGHLGHVSEREMLATL